ncbi:phage minor structural protein [Bacillus toyonensis]|uniref:phage tail spike protein n=1 Tax=Bacillus TaxID=1386 RepID=UPI000279DCAD|nr:MULTISPECIES: phage tail spike protein [Bacillus]EJR62761.1 phage minor structural protein [Bacillus toyonensis]MDF9890664.1 phage minor structural protein [Bacillus sp. LEw-kw-24]MDH6559277.1 phage minor structural protein [Bacillus sp. LEw-kw-2]
MSKANNLLHIVDFKTEQIIGVIKEQDYWDDLRQWELKDNKDKFEFTTADGTKIAASLIQQNLVVKQTRDGTFVSYIITEVEQDSTGRPKKIYALGEHTKLKKATVIKPQTLQATTVNESTDFALQGTEWKRGITEFVGIRTIHIKDFTNPLDLLKQIASTFELEIRFRTEIMGSFIVGRYIDLIKKVGRDNGKEFLLGKDVQGIRRIENSQDVVTALVGVGPQNSETGEFLTFEEINNGKLYVGNNAALQRWSKDGKHLFDIYSPQTEDQDMTKQRLKQLTEAELKKRIDSSTSYEVSAVPLEKVFGLSHESVRKGDTVRIKDTGFSPPLFLEARLIAADECDTDPSKDKYIFGNYREIKDTRSLIDRLYAQIMGGLSNKASKELLDLLDKKLQENVKETEVIRKESEAAKKIAEQVAESLKNNTVDIIEGINPPTENLKDRKTLWQDISIGKPGILKLWKDGKWDSVVPDVESVKKETLEQVSKDIETTKNELNQKVQEAQKQATGQFNEVKESLQGVSRTISDVQNKQGEIDKKVTKFEQDSNGFKLSIESLTKKDTDISNKLNTVEQTVEGTKKTISDVQQTANDLKKTTTEIKEQAGKISEKLTTVETKVNNDKAGGRNLLLDSNVKYEKTDYLINQYSLTENFSTGEEYTFVIKGSVLQGQKFGIWQNGGSNNVGYATSVYANGITYVTFKAVAATGGNERKLSLYNSPSNTTKAVVEWVALYKGNKPQDWTPAPENQVTNDEFTKKATEIEKSVNGIKETVTKVDNNQSGFDKRVTAVEKTAEGVSQNVGKLQETQTAQGKQISDAQSTIKQHSDALEMAVKMKDVENYVGGIGSINEIRDAGFTQGNKYWRWATGHSIDPNLKYKGYNSFSMNTTGQTQDVWWGAFSQFIDCSPNEDIVTSAYFNTDGKVPIDNGVFIELEFWQSNKATRISTARERVQIINNTWVRAICTAKAPAGTGFVRFRPYVQRNGRAWFCMPMLQRGKVATEFWLHPKDQTDADKMIEDIANRVATKDYDKKVTELERSISATEKGVSIISGKQETFINETYNAYVKKTESRLEVLDEGILAQILKDGIMTSINMSPGKITIDAEKLNINADTIVKWLTAKGIDADVIKISGDKVTIDKNGITAKMADFFFEDERGQKFSVTPRKNLIPDHDFSHISFNTFNNYFLKIEYSPTWTIMSNPYIEKPVVNNYEPMVNPMRIDLANWIRFTLFDGVKPGKKYTLSAHFRATTNDNRVNITNKPIMRAVFGKYNGDTPVEIGRASKTYDAPSIQTGKIVRYALTFTVPSNYVEGNGYVYIDLFGEGLLNNMQAIAVSGVQLVEGDVPSVYNWDTTHGELVNGTLPFSTIALGTKDNVIYHNHVNKWNYMNAPLEIISNGEMMALVGDDRAGLSFYPRGGGERRSYIGHIYNNENRFRIESKDPVATTQSIECNGINVCGGYFGANAGSIHYTNGSLGLGWYFHDGRWNYVDFTKMTSRT